MNVDQYQILASRTCSKEQTKEQQEDMAMMGMVGELGELAECFKKQIFHGKELTGDRAREEAGDFLWYVTLAATNKGARLSEWTGVPDFKSFDEAAEESLQRGLEKNPGITAETLCSQPAFFFQLAKTVTGGTTVPQALTILAVVLKPFGGLAWAARDNVRKLEARHGLPEGDLEAVPPKLIAIPTPVVSEPTTPADLVERNVRGFDAEEQIVNGSQDVLPAPTFRDLGVPETVVAEAQAAGSVSLTDPPADLVEKTVDAIVVTSTPGGNE